MCLLIAKKPLFDKKIILGPAEEQPLRMVELASAFRSSDERRFFESVMAKNISRAKQLGLYEDESESQTGRTRASLDHAFVKEVSDAISRSPPLLWNDVVLTVANVFYDMMSPFKNDIFAQSSVQA
ncbi:hypothetical protein [Sphingomonas lenta]|uniref:Uncharacterized protein n=1 Tax=Sphingomonas lenta TaxID=1141887 RepID=A0A2A2SD74_9SPHN|nr:hypothetical protein [Sphingomonas lenta]PAX06961.1 hypothetical protein CKY28_12900 [Sphingomonas lenta]